MAPQTESTAWYGDERVPLEAKSSEWAKRTVFGTQIKEKARRLFQARPRGNKQPKLGQMCLVMKGEAGGDEGQMALVSERTPAMVRVTYVCNKHGLTKTKLKHPSSLVMLDPGVTLVQDNDGTMWIRPCSN
jgi:hypothetical protein